jgi:hypothetical protein
MLFVMIQNAFLKLKVSFYMQMMIIFQNLDQYILQTTFKMRYLNRPGIFLDNNNALIQGIPQTYQDAYFKKIKYISDSGGKDILNPLANYLKNPKKLGLHLLIHPIWWKDKINSPTKTLNIWKNNHLDFIKSEIKKNCKTYKC